MNIKQLKENIQQYQYMEDTNIIDVAVASVIATRLKLGDPIWLVIIGASSGGKSQILRPLALTDRTFIHRLDDMTENTLLSGARGKEGEEMSLLKQIGDFGIIVISDLTVLFSKSSESRATILSQFRMLYDGEMVKYSGNKSAPIVWYGYLGVISGSTPSIYGMFEEVADMGERFIYYRMKEIDHKKATDVALNRPIFGKRLDHVLADFYGEYIKDVIMSIKEEIPQPSQEVRDRIVKVAIFAERVRTVASIDKYSREKEITRIPVSALPMRVALQLNTMARSLMAIAKYETGSYDLSEEQLGILDWCAYSLANEEKRACLRAIASVDWGQALNTQTIADSVGLSTNIVGNILQNLASTHVLVREGGASGLMWSFKNEEDYNIVRRIENIQQSTIFNNRKATSEESQELEALADEIFEKSF